MYTEYQINLETLCSVPVGPEEMQPSCHLWLGQPPAMQSAQSCFQVLHIIHSDTLTPHKWFSGPPHRLDAATKLATAGVGCTGSLWTDATGL
jgi:hypothetical protein